MNTAPHCDLAAVTPAMQDYLKAMYYLRDKRPLVTTQHLAEALDVSNPSVTSMVKRLHMLGKARHSPAHQPACLPQSHVQELP